MGYTPPITTGRGQALRAAYMAAGIFLGSMFTLVFAGMLGGGS